MQDNKRPMNEAVKNQTIVKVQTKHQQYPIHIGQSLDTISLLTDYLCQDGRHNIRHAGGRQKVLHIICDEAVYQHYGQAMEAGLSNANITYRLHQVPNIGEQAKSIEIYGQMLEKILTSGIDRSHVIAAWGGGVVGDLAGFIAGTILRGVRLIQIPTTLLAQVDSSVGGKTGINMQAGKNLVGVFYQPEMVLIDCRFLASLPERQVQAGYAEIAKYALINDEAFFDWLQQSGKKLLARDADALLYAIETSCRAKAAIVNQDEREAGIRAWLNLGHSFGHGLEKLAGYDGDILLHGEAVAIGIGMAFDYAEQIGKCALGTAKSVKAHFTDLGMVMNPHQLALKTTLNADNLLEAMRYDKKNYDESFALILPQRIGKVEVVTGIDAQTLHQNLSAILDANILGFGT